MAQIPWQAASSADRDFRAFLAGFTDALGFFIPSSIIRGRLSSNDDGEVWQSGLFGLSLTRRRSTTAPAVSDNHIENLGVAFYDRTKHKGESNGQIVPGHCHRPGTV
jgi:hypothetical protein